MFIYLRKYNLYAFTCLNLIEVPAAASEQTKKPPDPGPRRDFDVNEFESRAKQLSCGQKGNSQCPPANVRNTPPAAVEKSP
ncbi:hypothetical protein EVAR_61590_1 [Eumeta japonica]|uniref:Uncharacterized protein n=1 Tax=Eumeta variegata TaxID=151549 RepID=A0A4C1YLZ7_EUMVA|nr:hypothetical protein EVAR_61590_1 [Eumeta japonica]